MYNVIFNSKIDPYNKTITIYFKFCNKKNPKKEFKYEYPL